MSRTLDIPDQPTQGIAPEIPIFGEWRLGTKSTGCLYSSCDGEGRPVPREPGATVDLRALKDDRPAARRRPGR